MKIRQVVKIMRRIARELKSGKREPNFRESRFLSRASVVKAINKSAKQIHDNGRNLRKAFNLRKKERRDRGSRI